MGELAALLTAFCWAGSSIFFTMGGKEVGSVIVNRMRLVFAVILVLLAHWITQGTLLPVNAGWQRWMWLGLSGFAGLVLGDSFLFQAYILIGTRISMLLMAFAPVIGVIIAWLFLGETLSVLQIGGICLAVAGIAAVVMERRNGQGHHDLKHYILGILCGFGGAMGQAVGLVLAKKGLQGNFPAISGVAIRMLVSMISIWAVALSMGQIRRTIACYSNLKAVRAVALGSFVGPFLGVWFSLIGVQLTKVGIASTLNALTPIILLPIVKWGFKEQVSWRAVVGTVVTLIGVSVIILTT